MRDRFFECFEDFSDLWCGVRVGAGRDHRRPVIADAGQVSTAAGLFAAEPGPSPVSTQWRTRRVRFAGMLVGSVGQSVLHYAHCPVIVVPGRSG
ncbi:hypothetical protein GCM10027073_52040 [Streptomyces chlorus]|uniref:Universal stress protein n=1 Tax=Streptomyces chlorus TaxID=887452 RepID=A0ABW1DVF8_9ACTN